MPNSGLDDLSVAQQACTSIGLSPIATFEGDSAEQVVLNSRFETIVRSALSHYRYSWARIEVALNPSATKPLQRWDNAFLLPADVAEVNEFLVNDQIANYHRWNQYLFVDSDENQTNILSYTFRPITSQWPPVFTEGVIWKLAAVLTSSVKQDAEAAVELMKIGNDELARAQFVDSSGQTAGGFDLGNMRRVRQGGSRFTRKQ